MNCKHCDIPIRYLRSDCGEGQFNIVPYCDGCGAEWG